MALRDAIRPPGKTPPPGTAGSNGAVGNLMSQLNEMRQREYANSPRSRVDALQREMLTEANRFRSNLPDMQREQRGLLTRSAEQTRDQGIKDIRYGANRRGLLYSGYRQAAEGDLRSRVASTLAGQISQSNRELRDIADKKRVAAASVGLQNFGENVARAEQAYNIAYENSLLRAQAMQRLGEGLGYAFGAYANRPADRNTGLSVNNISYRPGLLMNENYGAPDFNLGVDYSQFYGGL